MSILTDDQNGRQVKILFFAVTCMAALGMLAIGVAGSSAFATTSGDNAPDPTEQVTQYSGAGLVGGGNIGGAESINLSTDETDPLTNGSSEVQFIATTEDPSYWRVGAYDQYSNDTWTRTGTYTSYRDQIEPTGPINNTAEYHISLKRSAAALPAPWQPANVSGPETQNLTVSSQGGIHAASPLVAGTNYTVRSYQTDVDPRELAIARRTYPEAIATRYTTLPNDTAARVVSLSNDLTTEAVTPGQAACAVEDWLAANKTYSRVPIEQSAGSPVETFLFEQERGNAKLMASSMALLLRAQDIPARYVTGYTAGEKRGEETYAVHTVNAHAWTEVYISGTGWVPFDPTPADTRRSTENQALGTEDAMARVSLPSDCAVTVDVEPLSDDEPDSLRLPNTTAETSTQENASSETRSTSLQSATEFDTSSLTTTNVTTRTQPDPLIIGGAATAEIQRDGDPASNVRVLLSGQQVGTTDEQGQINFTVPDGTSRGEALLVVRNDDIEEGAVVPVRQFRLNASRERVLALPGESVQITATVGSDPLEGVELVRNGEVVATTDANGTAAVSLSAASVTTIRAQYTQKATSVRIENRLLSVTFRAVGIALLAGIVGVILNRRFDLAGAARHGIARTNSQVARTGDGIVNSIINLPTKISTLRERGIRSSLLSLRRWLLRAPRRLRDRLPESILLYVIALGTKLYQALRGGLGTDESMSTDSPTGDTATTEASTPNSQATDSVSSIQQIWATFVRLVFRRVTPTYTPGEVARKAIDKGFPAAPVNRLTDTFRAAVYGPTVPDDVTVEATDALDEIKPAASATEQHTDRLQDQDDSESI